LGETVKLNWNFSGNSIPSDLDINGINQLSLSVGSVTAKPIINTEYVIKASNTKYSKNISLTLELKTRFQVTLHGILG
jgi:hypothetical protein